MKNYNGNIESVNFLLESEIAIACQEHIEFLFGSLQETSVSEPSPTHHLNGSTIVTGH